jgi:hypothetical protein
MHDGGFLELLKMVLDIHFFGVEFQGILLGDGDGGGDGGG